MIEQQKRRAFANQELGPGNLADVVRMQGRLAIEFETRITTWCAAIEQAIDDAKKTFAVSLAATAEHIQIVDRIIAKRLLDGDPDAFAREYEDTRRELFDAPKAISADVEQVKAEVSSRLALFEDELSGIAVALKQIIETQRELGEQKKLEKEPTKDHVGYDPDVRVFSVMEQEQS